MSNVASSVLRGYTSDPESSRESERIRATRKILIGLGAEPTVEHGNDGRNERVEFGQVKHRCADNCKTFWPAWVTRPVVESIASGVDVALTARGQWARSL